MLCHTSLFTFPYVAMSLFTNAFLQDIYVTFYSFYKMPRRICTTFKVSVWYFALFTHVEPPKDVKTGRFALLSLALSINELGN